MDGDAVMDGGSAPAAGAGGQPVLEQIVVYLANRPAVIVDLRALTSYEDLRNELIRVHEIDMNNKVLVDEHDNIHYDPELLAGNVPASGLAVKEQLPVTVHHAGFEYPMQVLFNSAKSTVAALKQDVEAQRPQEGAGDSFNTVILTWKGQPLADSQRVDQLEDIGLTDESKPKLMGHKTLLIHDLDLGQQSEAELPRVSDHHTLREVLMSYQMLVRRNYLHQPLLAVWNEELTADSIADAGEGVLLQQESTVYSCGLQAGSTLALKTQMFDVIVKEQSEIDRARQEQKGKGGNVAAPDVEGQRVQVFDWWRVRQMKDAYSTIVTESLGANDQIFLDREGAGGSSAAFEGELDDSDKLFKYGIRMLSSLIVRREDFTQPTCLYTCADCGSDVKLKQRDHVRCRECGHRIVFKKRIAKPCQYLCR